MTESADDEIDLAPYRLLAEALPHLVWFARPDGEVVFYNSRREVYGGLAADDSGVYRWAPIVHPDDVERTQTAWARAVEQVSQYECEHRVRMADGSFRWHLSRALPLRIGPTVMWFGTATDIQILNDAQTSAAESQARLQAVFAVIDQGFCVCELVFDDAGDAVDYRFLETNAQFEAATGLVDAAGRTALELVPDLERDWVDAYAAVAFGDRPVRFELRSDAMGRDFDVFAMPVAPRGRFALVFSDITERRAALEALQESERRFRNMADHAPVIIWVTDADGECTYLNRRWYETTGQTESEALGRGWLDATHPDDREAAAVAFAQATRDRTAFSLDYRLRHRDGSYRWAVDAAAPRINDDGQFLGFIGSVLDITDRKQAEQSVAHQRDQERAVALRLQQSMMPAAPLQVPGVEIATSYVAATDILRVGGDWYETFRTADGRLGLVVGDVVGHNVEAAAAMGQLRAGLLALAPSVVTPSALLCDLDRFAQRHAITDFATSLCVFLDPASGAIEYSSAGHPPALICPPKGPVRWLEGARSLPLGVADVDERPGAHDVLEPGSTLAMYTDGLVERRGESIEVGLARLARTVERHRGQPVQSLCSATLDELCPSEPSAPSGQVGAVDDDTVLLVLRFEPTSSTRPRNDDGPNPAEGSDRA